MSKFGWAKKEKKIQTGHLGAGGPGVSLPDTDPGESLQCVE